MPPVTRIQREDIIDIAFQITRKEGLEKVNARAIAKKLKCSIQPIFHKFTNMEEVKTEVIEKAIKEYKSYQKIKDSNEPAYKQMGRGYIKFAKEEPKLYQLLFMTENKYTPEQIISTDRNFEEISKSLEERTHLPENKLKEFHTRVWIFTHGIATLLATKTCEFTDEQIGELLTQEVEALLKLDEFNVR